MIGRRRSWEVRGEVVILSWPRLTVYAALSVAASGYVQRKHLEGRDDEASPSKLHLALHYWRLIDGFGLCLIGTVFAMLLIPFTLSTTASKGFKNPSLIAMFCVGGVLLIVLVLWEWKFASHPIMPKRIINRSLVCSIVIDFFYYLSGYISGTYFLSWVYIIKNDWTVSCVLDLERERC